MIKLSIVIVNWNSGDLLRHCIDSLNRSSVSKEECELIIVDNNSSDNSIENLTCKFATELICLEVNSGFARACNIGAKISKGKYLLFLNPDTRIQVYTLGKSIELMDKNQDISVHGVKHYNDIGQIMPSCAEFPTVLHFFNGICGLNKVNPLVFRSAPVLEPSVMDYSKSGNVDEVTGAYYFCRKADVENDGFFDERFFVYYEELDLSLRLTRNGKRIYYDSNNDIIHLGGGTTRRIHAIRLFYNLRSRLQYTIKHYNHSQVSLIFFLTLIVEPFSRASWEIVKRDFSGVINVVLGYCSLYAYLGRVILKRDWL